MAPPLYVDILQNSLRNDNDNTIKNIKNDTTRDMGKWKNAEENFIDYVYNKKLLRIPFIIMKISNKYINESNHIFFSIRRNDVHNSHIVEIAQDKRYIYYYISIIAFHYLIEPASLYKKNEKDTMKKIMDYIKDLNVEGTGIYTNAFLDYNNYIRQSMIKKNGTIINIFNDTIIPEPEHGRIIGFGSSTLGGGDVSIYTINYTEL